MENEKKVCVRISALRSLQYLVCDGKGVQLIKTCVIYPQRLSSRRTGAQGLRGPASPSLA